MMYTLPFLLTTLQSADLFFTEVLTFILLLQFYLFVPERYPASRQVVHRHLHLHLVAGEYPDVMLTHLARDMSRDNMAILKLNTERSIGKCLCDDAIFLNRLLLHALYNVCRIFFAAHLQNFMKHLHYYCTKEKPYAIYTLQNLNVYIIYDNKG